MLGFGLPELACRNDFGHNLAGPQARSIDIGDRVFGNPPLLVAGVEDRGSIAGPDVVALAIARAWVVNLEEELEDLSIADAGRIKDDLDCFGVSVMIAIGRVGAGAARVADPGRQNAVVAADEVLHAPEAASGKNGAFLSHWNPHLVQVSPITLGLHLVAMDEPQRGRVDAIAQSAAVARPVGKYVPEMAVAVRRAHLGARHAVRSVLQFVDVGRFNGLGEARPAASRFKFVRRSEQRLAGHDIDVDARFLVIQIFSGSGALGAVLLRYAILLRRELSDRLVALGELSHFVLL